MLNLNWDEAYEEFHHIASHTEGYNGCTHKSSNGHEFVIWLDELDDYPQPESDLIEWDVDWEDETFEGMYRFEMTLRYREND